MARRLYFCDDKSCVWREQVFRDSDMVLTALGERRADLLKGSLKAQNTLPGEGADVNGSVLYVARHGGDAGNSIRVAHSAGPIGGGHTNRPLAVSRSDMDIVVTFATDGAGLTVKPTAQVVADLIAADPDVSQYVVATANGTGAGKAEMAAFTNLGGGFDSGDHFKLPGKPPTLLRINTVDVE